MARRAKSDEGAGPPPSAYPAPETRPSIVGHGEALEFVSKQIAEGAFSNGWLVAGADGVGKATFAFQAARRLLEAGGDGAAARRAASLISAGAHPDLFVARRAWNEKTQKYAAEISVDVIRELTGFLTRTAAMGGWRVAIVDSADDMNRNAANALLKALEEPPKRSTVILTSAQPGRLLATIRSRCRRIDLRPLDDADVAAFLESEAPDVPDRAALARAAGGRPGFALRLALGEGAAALGAVEDFIRSSASGIPPPSVGRIAARGADAVWELFEPLLLQRLYGLGRRAALAGDPGAAALVGAHDQVRDALARGDGLNLDRAEVAAAIVRILARADVSRMAEADRAR